MKRLLFAAIFISMAFAMGGKVYAQTCYQFRAGSGSNPGPWSATPQEAIEAAKPCTNDSCGINSQCGSPHHFEVVSITGTWPNYSYAVQWYSPTGGACGRGSGGGFSKRACPASQYSVQAGPIPNSQEGKCTAAGKPTDCAGDPINPATGSVYDVEEDVALPGDGALRFRRFYNSNGKGSIAMGPAWRYSYSRQLAIQRDEPQLSGMAQYPQSSFYSTSASACASGFAQIQTQVSRWSTATSSWNGSSCVLQVGGQTIGTLPIYGTVPRWTPSNPIIAVNAVRDDGTTIRFVSNGTNLVAPSGTSYRLETTASGYRLTDLDDTVEEYDSVGVLQNITARGITQILAYDSKKRLESVTDPFGNRLSVLYDTFARIKSVNHVKGAVLPGSVEIQYAYDTQGRLTTVTYPDTKFRTFLYENSQFPKALTGVLDEAQTRVSTWSYDANGRAISAERAGGADAVTLSYPSANSVTVTDALGAVRTFNYELIGDQLLPVSITGAACPTCRNGAAMTYDIAGFVSSRTDFNGNVTCHAHDPIRGLELARIEGFGPGSTCPTNLLTYTPAPGTSQRKITTQWHATLMRPEVITEANRTTSFTYDSQGDVLTKTISDTSQTPNSPRTTTYSYDAFGRRLTEDGPRTDVSDVTTYTYYTCTTGLECGHLQTVTDALSHTTTYNTYNSYGQPLTMTDPNGILITMTYDARHRLASRTAAGEATTLEYWPTGLLKKATLPDSSFMLYTYDAAHRLYKIEDGAGNRIEYTLDSMGNRTAENAYDPSTALARSHSPCSTR